MGRKALRYDGCGLSNVFLLNGFDTEDGPYGALVAIHNVEGLHAAIADSLVDKKGPLTGSEFRFLRRFLELSQKACGEWFNVDAQTVANWEKHDNVDQNAANLLRGIVRQHTGGNVVVKDLVERTNERDRELRDQKLMFKEQRGWKLDKVVNG